MASFLGKRDESFEDDAQENASSSQLPHPSARSQEPIDDMECEDLVDDVVEEDEGEVVDCQDELNPEINPPAEGMPMLDDDDEKIEEVKAWRPEDGMQEGEVLDFDPSVYHTLHQMSLEWPCLSFDFVPDQLGARRTKFPHTLFYIAGSQADRPKNNKIFVVKVSDIHKTKEDNMEDSDDSDDDDVDDDPDIEWREVPVYGGINRIRCMPQRPQIVATWSETGKVFLYDIKTELNGLGYFGAEGSSNIGSSSSSQSSAPAPKGKGGKKGKGNKKKINFGQPILTFDGHSSEGYALNWSPTQTGTLLSGDNSGLIYLCSSSGGKFNYNREPFAGHSDSVEDIQWNPTLGEGSVFASCGVDRTIRLWDSRTRKPNDVLRIVDAHSSDINVMSWNPKKSFLLASGDDVGTFRVWDLRMFQGPSRDPLVQMNYHKQPITSIEWHPEEESVLICGCADNMTTIWDMDMKKEEEELGSGSSAPQIPSQLLFVHQGQKDVKEIHWHRQIPGLVGSTASDNFHIFKTINT